MSCYTHLCIALFVSTLLLAIVASSFVPCHMAKGKPIRIPTNRWTESRLHSVATTFVQPSVSESVKSTETASVTTIGNWEEVHGNYLLRPQLDEGPPRALLHFLGGAIVGHSPHICYRYMLERLASKGYLVVATPYNLSFDHLTTCDEIIAKFERVAKPLARTYGALPVVGIGHSCGSLLQLLITSLFPDTPRAANALISYNNKPVSEAVPFFDEFFAPFFTYVAARNVTTNVTTTRASGSDIIRVSLDMATSVVQGDLPSDELLSKAGKLLLSPTGFGSWIPDQSVVLPVVLRNAYTTLSSPTVTALSNAGVIPILTELFDTLQQVPLLIDEVADGARDFIPPPSQVKAAARRSYRARRTLIVQYLDDPIDESMEVEELLQTAGQIIQMKRPMIQIDVQMRSLSGNHVTPLWAPPLDVAGQVETILGTETAQDVLQYTSTDRTVDELIRWLEESNL
jgi:hypothetical protein